MHQRETGKMKAKFFVWPSIVISIVLSILLTLALNLLF